MGLPKTTLCLAYSTLFPTNHLVSPMHSAERRILSGLRMLKRYLNPFPSSPISLVDGIFS